MPVFRDTNLSAAENCIRLEHGFVLLDICAVEIDFVAAENCHEPPTFEIVAAYLPITAAENIECIELRVSRNRRRFSPKCLPKHRQPRNNDQHGPQVPDIQLNH